MFVYNQKLTFCFQKMISWINNKKIQTNLLLCEKAIVLKLAGFTAIGNNNRQWICYTPLEDC